MSYTSILYSLHFILFYPDRSIVNLDQIKSRRKNMNSLIKMILLLSIWIGLPLLIYLFFRSSIASSIDKPIMLFILYTGFSWTIAVMIFIMESARQQLFQQTKPVRSALRLGAYGTVAVLLALFANPQPGMFSITEKVIVIVLVFLYGGIMGYVYQRSSNSNKG